MRFISGCLVVIGAITVLLLLTLGVGYYLLSLSPPIERGMTLIAPTEEAARSFDQKFQAFKSEIEAAIKAGRKEVVSLTINESEATSKLAEVLSEERAAVKELYLDFTEGSILALARVPLPGIEAKIAARVQPEVVGGSPKLVIKDINFGRVPLPQNIKKMSADLIGGLIKLPLGEQPIDFTQINVRDGELAIMVVTKVVTK